MDLRSELHEALDVEDFPSRALLTQAIARLDEPRPHRHFAAAPAIAAALIAGALVVTLVAVNLNGATTSLGPSLPTASSIDNLVSYNFASPEVGWVHVYAGSDVVAKTSDGGRTWHRQLSVAGLDRTPTMQWIDANNGVLIGQKGDDGVVWKTRDGGAHWQSHVVTWSNLTGTLHPPHWTGATGYFVDANHGWVTFYGEPCRAPMLCPPTPNAYLRVVYGTADGGVSWTELGQLTGLLPAQITIQFVSPSVGILAGKVGWSQVFATHDGGRHWEPSQVPFGAPTCSGGNCFYAFTAAPVLFTATEGVLVATLLQGSPQCLPSMRCPGPTLVPRIRALLATQDGGRTWAYMRNLPSGLDLFVFTDSHHVVDIGPESVAASADLGATWSPVGSIPIPVGWYLNKAQFVDSKQGWVTLANYPYTLSINGGTGDPKFAMLATSDGGATWHQISLPKVEAINPTGGTSAQPR